MTLHVADDGTTLSVFEEKHGPNAGKLNLTLTGPPPMRAHFGMYLDDETLRWLQGLTS